MLWSTTDGNQQGKIEYTKAANTAPSKVDEPSTWAKGAWDEAKGILDGTNPQGQMTREQFAVAIDRLGLLD